MSHHNVPEDSSDLKKLTDRLSKLEKDVAVISTIAKDLHREQEITSGKYRKFAESLKTMAGTESGQMKAATSGLVDAITKIEEERMTMVTTIDNAASGPLKSLLGPSLKAAKEAAASQERVAGKLFEKTKNLEKIVVKNDRAKVEAAKKEVDAMAPLISQANADVKGKVAQIEKEKVNQMKLFLSNLVYSHIVFHAKALQIYSDANHDILDLDKEEDAKEFITTLNSMFPSD
eukprot:GFYU01041494.1.p1 GENE.GFYU01041494.1~~GFYU01041494.1.p1  ORF type:complete len:232 (+),score=61.03 GFYU01041494.1:128-823(+)